MRCWLLLACHLQVDERGQALPFKTVSLLLDGSESHDSFCVHSHTHAHISLIFRVVELLIYMEITSEWFPSLTQGEITEKCTCTHCWWFSLPRKCFCRFLGSFAWRARTMRNSSPGKLREMSIMEKKNWKHQRKKFCFILKLFGWHNILNTFYALSKSYKPYLSLYVEKNTKNRRPGMLKDFRILQKTCWKQFWFFFCSKTHKNMYASCYSLSHMQFFFFIYFPIFSALHYN